MKKTFKKLLCSTFLLTMPMVAFANNEMKEDNTYCPLFTALEVSVGKAAWIDKSLSYLTFDGPTFSLGLEMMRAAKGDSKLVRQHQLRFMYNIGKIAVSKKGGSNAFFGNYTFGMMTHKEVYPKLRLYYGFDAGLLGGFVNNAHKGNNPTAFKIDVSAGLTGMAVYDFKLGKYPITGSYQMALPVVSTFIQINRGYITSGLLDGWNVGSWESCFNMRNRLNFDVHFDSWALRLGYNNDILTNYATPNHFQYVSHNFVVGFTGELMRWSVKNENKKIKPALYRY